RHGGEALERHSGRHFFCHGAEAVPEKRKIKSQCRRRREREKTKDRSAAVHVRSRVTQFRGGGLSQRRRAGKQGRLHQGFRVVEEERDEPWAPQIVIGE